MGKTVPAFSQVIDALERRFADFRRALRREDKVFLDTLFDLARFHTPSSVQHGAPDPLEPIVFSILLSQQREMARLRAQLDALEERVRHHG